MDERREVLPMVVLGVVGHITWHTVTARVAGCKV